MTEHELSVLLVSLVLILSLSLVFGHIFSLFGIPRVVGEIFAGIALGPSLLGHFSPSLFKMIFAAFEGQDRIISAFYWIGLILLMFTAGFQLTPRVSRRDGLICICLIAGGLFLPFTFGVYASEWFPNEMKSNSLSFALIFGAASAVTSIPVLTRIFIDLKIASTAFAKNVLMAAALQDIIVWFVVAIALSMNETSIENYTFDVSVLCNKFIKIIIFIGFALLIFPKISKPLGVFIFKTSPEASLVGYTLLGCLFLVVVASALNVQIILASLISGIVIGRRIGDRFEMVKNNIQNISLWFFVPIYFALVGQKMNLIGSFNLEIVLTFFIGSSLVKILSVVGAVRFAKLPWRLAIDYGVTMNCRGGPGIALASVAFSARIITEELFIAFVFTAILTSILAGVWLKFKENSL